MERRDILTNIEDRYNQSIIAPVNPFTVDNPDALVYNGSSLTGLFIPLAKELNNPDLLLRRLCFSRLSLSNTVSHVLLLGNGNDLIQYDQVSAAFDAVIVYENMHDLLLFLGDNIHARHRISPRIRKERMRRFWGTLDYIEKHGFDDDEYGDWVDMVEFDVQSWCEPDKSRYSRNAGISQQCLIAKKRVTKQSFIEGYESLMTYTAMFNYSLNDGILKPHTQFADYFQFLNVEDLDALRNNTMGIRTLAFMGYLPCRVKEDYDLKGLRDRYFTFMVEKRYL